MRAKTTDQQHESGTGARHRGVSPSSRSSAHDLSGSLLDLQQSHGNRFVAGLLGSGSERQRCHCGGTCSHCKDEEQKHDREVVAGMLHHRGRLSPEMAAFLGEPQRAAPSHARCPTEGCTDDNPLARHQGSGTTVCNKSTGTMDITALTEHCAGDCVFQHEHAHQLDDAPCCARVKACIDAAPDAAAKAKCASDYDAWFASNADHAECVAYTTEVDCLTRFIAGNCDGHHEQAEGGALIGGVVGGIGGFLAGGIGGAVAGGAAGAAAGYAAGLVSPACCTTLKTELTFARSQKATHCAAAVNHPCPV